MQSPVGNQGYLSWALKKTRELVRLAGVGRGQRESIPTKRPHNRKKACGIWEPRERWDAGSGDSKKERTPEGLRREGATESCGAT